MARSPDGGVGHAFYGVPIKTEQETHTKNRSIGTKGTPMMPSEFDIQFAGQYRQAEDLAEAAARRLTRTQELRREEPQPTTRRLSTLLRKLAGAPSFA